MNHKKACLEREAVIGFRRLTPKSKLFVLALARVAQARERAAQKAARPVGGVPLNAR
jgi:hypothetical protein